MAQPFAQFQTRSLAHRKWIDAASDVAIDVDVIIIERDDRTVAINAPFIVSRETTILIWDDGNKDYQDKGLGNE